MCEAGLVCMVYLVLLQTSSLRVGVVAWKYMWIRGGGRVCV